METLTEKVLQKIIDLTNITGKSGQALPIESLYEIKNEIDEWRLEDRQKTKELVEKLGDLFCDKVIGKIKNKLKNDDEKNGAWLLKEHQFKEAYPILKELEL